VELDTDKIDQAVLALLAHFVARHRMDLMFP
jgi:hypothetical protein